MAKIRCRTALLALGLSIAASSWGATFTFSTGAPDGRIATASRPANAALSQIEIESADDFILASQTTIDHATFTGLLPSAAPLTGIQQVVVEIYRVFPLDSVNPPSGHVPTRANSPSDVDFASRDSSSNTLSYTASIVNATFSAVNSVVNGINPKPNQTTGGEGAVSGEEVVFDVTFTTPFVLPAGHYFFIPKVGLSSGNFLWLSVATPIAPDLQSWIRNANLDPDWLRIGTDIVGGGTPSTFNAAFSLSGTTATAPVFQSAVSRRVHAGAGTFDLPLSAVTTNPTTEPRQGPGQTIVFTFDRPINAATAIFTEGTATAGTPTFSGSNVIVTLTGVSNQQYVTIALTNVSSSDGSTGGSGSVRVGFLLGDVNQNRVVSLADLALVNAQLAQVVTAANYLKDVNASGSLSLADKAITNANLAKALPAP